MAVGAAGGAWVPTASRAQALFAAGDVEVNRFVLVAAPIGSSGRSQLNIYEQLNDRRPCFEVGAGKPAPVNPLLGTFDFTGICGRYIDANGFSARVGEQDLATTHRLSVVKDGKDVLLMALPTRSNAGPEMLVARAGGLADGFVKLEFEPGWTIKRRQFGGRALGHVYLYVAAWPGGGGAPAATGPAPQTTSPAATTTTPVAPSTSAAPPRTTAPLPVVPPAAAKPASPSAAAPSVAAPAASGGTTGGTTPAAGGAVSTLPAASRPAPAVAPVRSTPGAPSLPATTPSKAALGKPQQGAGATLPPAPLKPAAPAGRS